MSVPALTGLTIENLRGSITPFNLPLAKNRKLTIVYGENGSGKSTVADAFDLLGNGQVGSLSPRGLGQTRKFWPSIGKSAGDVRVLLDTASGQCNVSLSKSDVVVQGNSLRPYVDVLRRSQILGLIEAKAADRYKAIRRFVDVTGVEDSEATLRRLIRDKENAFNAATTRISENHATIDGLWEDAGKPGAGAAAWARKVANEDGSVLDERKRALNELIALWDKATGQDVRIATLVNELKAAHEEQATANAELDRLKDSAASDYVEILDLLKAAQTHFHKYPHPSKCPLCESTENAASLSEEVDKRLASQGLHDKLEAAKKIKNAKDEAAQSAQQRVDDARKEAAVDANALANYCNDDNAPSGIGIPQPPDPENGEAWAAWIAENAQKRGEWLAASEACTTDKQLIKTLNTMLAPLANNEAQAKALETLLPRLKQILKLVTNQRKQHTDNILAAISNRVGELYEAMHPGEGLSKIAMELDAAKRASLDITAAFGGKNDTPPQAYFSDSHLDTLGLCIFLALAERESPEDKILVLDDVLGSVDEPHVERVINTIYDVSKNFRHTVITTHYRPWREKFRWGLLKPDQQCHFLELNEWTLSRGITQSGGIVTEIERLKTLLADMNPDIQSIAAKSGVILEALLDFLTLKYSCAVPRKPGNTYVLGDFLGAIHGKLLTALKVETVDNGAVTNVIELKPVIDDIKTIAQARNVLGAHFNANSFDLNSDEGMRFGRKVEELCDALVCPQYGHPMKNAGSFWKNGGDTRRLYPLSKPAK